jgi:hypothetical protein
MANRVFCGKNADFMLWHGLLFVHSVAASLAFPANVGSCPTCQRVVVPSRAAALIPVKAILSEMKLALGLPLLARLVAT